MKDNELELKELVERRISAILDSGVSLYKVLDSRETSPSTGEVHDCSSYAFTSLSTIMHPWLNRIIVMMVPKEKEIAFLSPTGCMTLPCMSENEKSMAKDSVITVEVERLTGEDFKHVVEANIEPMISSQDLAESLAMKVEKLAGFVKCVPLEFDYNEDSRLVILNMFIRGQLMGFIDCFFDKKGLSDTIFYAVSVDLTDKSGSKPLTKKECQRLEDAVRFIISGK